MLLLLRRWYTWCVLEVICDATIHNFFSIPNHPRSKSQLSEPRKLLIDDDAQISIRYGK